MPAGSSGHGGARSCGLETKDRFAPTPCASRRRPHSRPASPPPTQIADVCAPVTHVHRLCGVRAGVHRMRVRHLDRITSRLFSTDFLVIGSGVAGQRAALSPAEVGQVTVDSKAHPRESNNGAAQGGIAAAVGPDDSPELHARDTIAAGDGLFSPHAGQALVTDGPRYVAELMEWGAAFDRDAQGAPPSAARPCTASAACSMRATPRAGISAARRGAAWRIHSALVCSRTLVLSLDHRGRRLRGRDLHRDRRRADRPLRADADARSRPAAWVTRFARPSTRSWRPATAWPCRSGRRAGGRPRVAQFDPTVLSVAGAPRFLLSEALRGEVGASNADGQAFVQRVRADRDLALRDVVARAIAAADGVHGRAGVPVAAASGSRRLSTLAPDHFGCLRGAGLDLARDRVPAARRRIT